MACETLPPPLAPLRLTLPGGAALVGADLATLAQPSMAPLAPFFRLADVAVKTVDVVRAIPDALSVPPDPTQILQRLPALVDALAQLLPILPQVSLPLTAVGVLDGVIEELRRTRARLAALDLQARRIEYARARARELGDARLLEQAGCAELDLATAVAHVLSPLASVQGLLAILGLLLGLAGGPSLPPWNFTESDDRGVLESQLRALEDALRAVRGSLQLP
jgi:hypothetical protein